MHKFLLAPTWANNNRTQLLGLSSLCLENSINEMYLPENIQTNKQTKTHQSYPRVWTDFSRCSYVNQVAKIVLTQAAIIEGFGTFWAKEVYPYGLFIFW